MHKTAFSLSGDPDVVALGGEPGDVLVHSAHDPEEPPLALETMSTSPWIASLLASTS